MSALKDRFERWTAADIVAMKGVEQENRHLDFKRLSRPDFGKDDQRNLAKAASGFANAEGGVILWGVDARRDPSDDYIDQVVDTPGVDNARKLLARLNELSADVTSPSISGLDHRLIEGEGGDPDFIATFVPEGDAGPYMAMLDEARHRYYRRIGSAFVPMDHSMVADMFGRRPRAELRLALFASSEPAIGAELENFGRGIAVAPYLLFFDVHSPFRVPTLGIHPPEMFPLPRTRPGSRGGLEGYVGSMQHLIHPGLRLRFEALELSGGIRPFAAGICRAGFRYGAAGIAEQQGHLVYDFEKTWFVEIAGAQPIQPH